MARRRRRKERAPPKTKDCIAFKWKTETIYLPDVVITSELRRIADEHLNREKNDKVEDAVPENDWDPVWDEEGGDDEDLFEVVKKSDVMKSKPRTRNQTSEGESPRKKVEKGPTSISSPPKSTTKRKSIDATPADNGTEEKKESSNTDLLKQKFKDRNQLFKNLMESQPKKCEKCSEEYSDEDSHMKVCPRQLLSQSSFRTFDTRSKPAELKCLDCGKTFQKKIHLTLHQKIHASMDKPILRPASRTFICNFCDKRFERNDDLLSHYQRQHNISNNLHVHQLNTVNRSSTKPASKTDHTQFIGDEFDCKKCFRVFKTWNQINIHVRMCKAKPTEQQQDQVSTPPSPMFVSESSDSNDTPPSSPVPPEPEEEELSVPAKDPSDSLIISNVRSVGGNSQNLPRAPSSILSQTDNSPDEEIQKPYKCCHCPRRFKFQLQLKLHKKSHYRLCISCNKQIPEDEYSAHSAGCISSKIVPGEVVSKEEQKTCEICGTSFNSNFLLSQHCLIHAFSLETFSDIESAEFQSNLPFGCLNIKCGNRFSHQSDRALHLKEKHSGENFGHCGECGREFCSIFNLMRHRSSAHNLDNSLMGSNDDRTGYRLTRPTYYYIQKGFRHDEPPNPHILITDDVRLPAEEVLGKMTSSSAQSTMYSSFIEEILEAPTKKFGPNLYLRSGNKPLRRKDIPIQSIYTCETCNKTFTQSQRKLYIIHLAEHKYPCQLCTRSFRTEGLLQQHSERHNDPSYVPGRKGRIRADIPFQSSYACKLCDKTFTKSERQSFLIHVSVHKSREKFKCHLCSVRCLSEKQLQQHLSRHDDPSYVPGLRGRRHDIPIQSEYTCETCNKKFKKSERTLYIQHLREHKFTCHLCDRKFQSENQLKQHLKRHEDPNYVPGQSGRFRTDVPIQEKYTCETCSATFAGSERTPYLIHLAEHKYTCHLCDRKFQSEPLFKQHLKRHEDPNYVPGQSRRFRTDVPIQENYTCETCGKTFTGSERTPYLIHLSEHKYTCHLCDRKFPSENLFKQHLKRHEDPNYVPGQSGRFRTDVPIQEKYTCETCSATFAGTERTPYLIHLAEHKYTCHLCDRKFPSENPLKQHLKRHEDPNYVPGQRGRIRSDIPLQSSYTCESCDKTFSESERSSFLIHLSQHKREEKFKCQLCGRKHLSEKLLEQHLKRHDDPRYEPGRRLRTDIPIQSEYTCGTCGKIFDDRTLYIGHIYQHKQNEEFKCKICNEQFTTKGAYRDHMQTHEDPSYEPDTSAGTHGGPRMSTDIPDQGMIHLSSHEKKKFACPLCHLRFLSNFALQQHKKRHEDPSYVPRERAQRLPIQDVYTCEICHRQFSKRATFRVHMYHHRAKEKYGCHLCERKFISGDQLQEHIRKHLDPAFRTRRTWKGHKRNVRVDVPYQDVYRCEVCGGKDKTFTDRIKYLMHLRNHFLEENFPCPHCPRRFKSNQNLKCHIETHSQIKSYECKECLKRFRTSNCFRLHTMRNCKKVPCKVQCSICDDRFHTTGALQKHFQRYHTDKETDNGNEGSGNKEQPEPEVEHPCPHCRQTFNTTLGLSRHLCLYHPTTQAGLESRNNFMNEPNNTNGSNQDGQTAMETETADKPTDSEVVDDKDPTWTVGNDLDQDDDDDDYGYDISDMLATDFCETEMAEAEPPESATSLPQPPKASRAVPPKRSYSRNPNACNCKYSPKLLRKRCHSLQCPCMKADKRCSKKCKCATDCLNRADRDREQQQLFKEGRENMIQEEIAQRDSSESSPGFEDEELEDELPVPMEITPSAPIIVGQLSSIANNQPSTSTGYSNVMMSSEFISIDTSEDNNFIDEADDVDPLADVDPLQAQEVVSASNKSIPSQAALTVASLPINPVSLRPTESRLTLSSGIVPSTGSTHASVSNNTNPSNSLDNFNQSALLRCQFCKKVFKTMPSFISHFLVHGADFRTLNCPLCNKEYTFLSDYIHHLDQHNKGIFMDCKKCSSRFKSFKDMDKHLLVHHYKPMECGLCSEKFPTSQLMMAHWSKLHSTCQCGLCNVKFFSYEDLTFHMKSLHSPFDCVHCGSRFEKVDPLLDHFLAKHYINLHKSGTSGAAIPQPAPASTSATNTSLTLRKSTPQYTLKCDHCGILFTDHESLNAHLATHLTQGRPERQNNLTCDKCGEIFTNAELLHDHLSRHIMGTLPAQHHLGSTPSASPQISSTFSASIGNSSTSSMVFMRFTDGNSEYTVQQEPVVAQKDKINDNLDAVEVFTCPKCYKTYNAKHIWMMHLRSYNQPLCSACGSLFETRDELLRHLENKDGRNLPICVVYECRHCLKNFNHGRYLTTHLKKHTRSNEASNSDSVPVIIASTSLAPQKGQAASSTPNYQWHEYVPPNPIPGGAVPGPGASSGEVEEIFLD